MSKLVVSSVNPEIVEGLKKEGFELIFSESLEILPEFERNHADMQCLRINETFFVLKECVSLRNRLSEEGLDVRITTDSIGGKYPENVLLNAVYYNSRLYCKESSVDKSVKEYCSENEIEIVNVNQGYAKCSVAVLNDGFITADIGIFEAMSGRGERGILVSPGNIELDGVDYGFIGGCCFENNGRVFFSGDISKHPDYKRIKEFLKGKEIVALTDKKLYDIGGFVAV